MKSLLLHKCSKGCSLVTFWGIVFVIQFAAADVVLERRLSQPIRAWISSEFTRAREGQSGVAAHDEKQRIIPIEERSKPASPPNKK